MGIHLCYNWGKLIVLAKVSGWVRIMFQTHTGISYMATHSTCIPCIVYIQEKIKEKTSFNNSALLPSPSPMAHTFISQSV